ncbi:hypothetical protein [Halopiger goleimassiliensis]|uniref:hypothetical protein n=1 Tax=Halopiger goleimassiliensis TaxID=1293048 RepID=UPI0012B5BA52|nr:hypothetical protein [Halopiger goleimassiliensis]
MTGQDRRTFLQTIGAGGLGALATGAVGTAAAETTVAVEGGGYDIWNDHDEFHYYYEEVDGDFDVTVRVDALEDTDEYAKAGLMVRQSLAANEEHAMIRKMPGHGTSFQWRSDDGDQAESTTSDEGEDQREVPGGTMAADWQRLVREDDTIRAYGSTDGENWTLIAEISPSAGTIDFADSAYVGLAVTSHDEGTLCTAQFSSLSGLSPSNNTDIGDVDVSGSVSTEDGTGGGGGGGDTDPVVSTGSASNVTEASASLGGAVDDLGGADEVAVSFEYRASGALGWQSTPEQTLSSTGTVSYQVSELAPGTSYEFRAVLEASDGDSDVGSTNTFETAAAETDGIVVEGAGADIWNEADEGHYYFADVSGDFDATVRVDALEDTDEYAKAGLLFRESLEADATNVMVRKTPGHDTSVQWRPETGSESTSLTSDAGESEREIAGGTMVADYQRLVRTDDAFLAYGSDDGEDWTLMAELSTDVIDPDESGYLGLAVTSHNPGTLCAAAFSELGGVSPTHNQDIGNVEVAGSVSGNDGGDTDTEPLVATGSAEDVHAESATVSGTLESLGQAPSAEVAFEYREAGADSWAATSGQTVTEPGPFTESVTDLSSETEYEFRATVTASDGDVDTGSIATVTTAESDTEPAVATGDPTEIDATSATVSGTLEAIGGQAETADVFFEYRVADDDDEWNASSPATLEEPGAFDGTLFGLSGETEYEYRAVAEADDGDVATGQTRTFETEAGDTVGSGGSHFDYTDGFSTPAPWLESEDVQVITITEPDYGQVKDAVQTAGPRVIVFECSGTIEIEDETLEISEDKCWMAGQTAPSPGITFVKGQFQVDADDCVIQHIRSRHGPGSEAGDVQSNDAVNTDNDATNTVFDHVTASWGTDECMSLGYYGERNSMINCLVYEGLWDPYGESTDHNYATLIGDGNEEAFLAGNVWAKARGRIPRLKDDTETVVVNNFTYFFDESASIDSSAVTTFVGNGYTGLTDDQDEILEGGGTVYVEDNYTADPPLDDTDFASSDSESEPPLWPDGLEVFAAEQVEEHNLQYAGARPADRTYHDQRIVAEIQTRAGNDRLDDPYEYWVGHQDEVGGFPDLEVNYHDLDVPDTGLREWLEGWALAVEEPDASPP